MCTRPEEVGMRHASTATPRGWAIRATSALLACVVLVAAGSSAATGAARDVTGGPDHRDRRPPAADPAAVTDWHQIAVATITGPAPAGAGKNNAEAFLWFAFVQAAVHNAVNGITGDFDLYEWRAHGPRRASPEAAAAAAAHRVLRTYFGDNPTIAANLDAALETSLAGIPNGTAERQGVRFGERAADHIIRLRADDGRFAPITFDVAPAAGVWRPTPPANLPFFDPWLGFVDPLVVRSLRQFGPGPPPPISSDLYVEEFEEVRDYGVRTGSLRTPEQTETALFFSDAGIVPLQTAVRDLVIRRDLDISRSARLLAAVELATADAIGTVWRAKFRYGWWRPITAIREADTDGNPATAGVPGWEPLIVTPPYPDWPSGLTSVVGATSTVLSRLDRSGRVDLDITSAAAGVTRHYEDARTFIRDAIDARVLSGIHFRTADEAGARIGIRTASWTLDHHLARR
jgi:hypothetical protein